jgi:hypothetical protein
VRVKLLVCGSRTYINYREAEATILAFMEGNKVDEIISGGARGADRLAEVFCRNHNIPNTVMKAEWRKDGALDRGAGFARNLQMLELADHVIAFWDGSSPGTKHTFVEAQKRGIPVTLVINTNYAP